ncbi:MAG: WecB/TagA/CpsF family glycosyltransferase [Caldilineaceae bacterium]
MGTPIDDVTMDEALGRIDQLIAIGRATGRGHQIATVNADFVVKALRDAELRRILQESDMATADGMPLVWGAHLLGVPLEGRVTGADMVPALAKRAAEKGYSMYFLGAAPGVAEQAANILRTQNPGLKIVGISAPPQAPLEKMDPSIVEACKAAKPDILLVAFGNPKQEKWIYRHAQELSIPVMMGVGGTFDFIAGVTKRAPTWMQQTGLEWVHRLVQEPRRLWKRYAVDLLNFSYFFGWQWWTMQRGHMPSALLPESESLYVNETGILNLAGRLDASNYAEFADKAHALLAQNPHLIVNLARAEFLDSTAIGTLLSLTKQARAQNGQIWLIAVPAPILRVIKLLRLDQFFKICDTIEDAMELRWEKAQTDVSTAV